jgi:hypothetical protein
MRFNPLGLQLALAGRAWFRKREIDDADFLAGNLKDARVFAASGAHASPH